MNLVNLVSHFFSFLYHTFSMARMIHVLLCYPVQYIFVDYSPNRTKRGVV